MPMAPSGVTKPAAGVIATRPAMAPVIMPSVVGRLLKIQSSTAQVSRGRGRRHVRGDEGDAARPPAVSALPALKPNQPNQSSAAPRTANGRLCGGEISG